jgi:hypothetical protein
MPAPSNAIGHSRDGKVGGRQRQKDQVYAVPGCAKFLEPASVPASGERRFECEVAPFAGQEAQALEHHAANGNRVMDVADLTRQSSPVPQPTPRVA